MSSLDQVHRRGTGDLALNDPLTPKLTVFLNRATISLAGLVKLEAATSTLLHWRRMIRIGIALTTGESHLELLAKRGENV